MSVPAACRFAARAAASHGSRQALRATAPRSALAQSKTALSRAQPVQFRAFHAAPVVRSDAELSKTGLFDFHVRNGAKMVPFGGYSMPLNYKSMGHSASHHHVRTKAGLFDVGHMVQHRFSGPGALEFLEYLTPASLKTMPEFNSTLSVLLNEKGGILDDLIITKHAQDKFYVVTNAGRRQEDLAWIGDKLKEFSASKPEGKVEHEVMEGWGLLALQGPSAAEVLKKLVPESFDLQTLTFGKSAFVELKAGGSQVECHVARAGYTGEDGFEVSLEGNTLLNALNEDCGADHTAILNQ